MSYAQTINLWKDPDSRPVQPDEHPAGDLTAVLDLVGGIGISSENYCTLGCCQGFTNGNPCC